MKLKILAIGTFSQGFYKDRDFKRSRFTPSNFIYRLIAKTVKMVNVFIMWL